MTSDEQQIQSDADKTNVKNAKIVRRGMRERWSYIILVSISVFLSFCVLEFGIIQLKQSNHKFCQLLEASLAGGIPVQPKNPKAAPAQEKLYKNFIIVDDLGASLGCHVPKKP